MTTIPNASWLGYCRAGFEPDLVAELTAMAGAKPSAVTAVAGSGFVHIAFSGRDAKRAQSQLTWSKLVFARQFLRADAQPVALRTRLQTALRNGTCGSGGFMPQEAHQRVESRLQGEILQVIAA